MIILLKCNNPEDISPKVPSIVKRYLQRYPNVQRITVDFTKEDISVFSKGEKDTILFRRVSNGTTT